MPTDSRSVNPVKSAATQAVLSFADFTGAGAAAPTVSAASVLPLKDNYAAARDGNTTVVTRSGLGQYTFLFPNAPAVVLDVTATVRGPSNMYVSFPAAWAIVGGRLQVQVQTNNLAGANADMTTGDFLRFAITGNISNS